MSLTGRILLGMGAGLVLGALIKWFGQSQLLAPGFMQFIDTYFVEGLFLLIGKIFVASLKLLVVPLVFVSLVCGAGALGDSSKLGRVGIKTIGLYLLTTATAIVIALFVANLVNPGMGVNMAEGAVFVAKESPPLINVLINIFPSNPVKAMAEGNMLQVIVFAILLGVAIARSGEAGTRVAQFFVDMNEVIMKLVTMLMSFAPYGVFCLMAQLFAHQGIGVIGDLAWYFFTVIAVLLLHGFGTYAILIKVLGGLNPIPFYRKMRATMMFAFSTASSNATIPVTLKTVESRLGVKNSIASFTVPLGATINMDGTAIMQGVATVFIAQAYNIDIGLSGYLMVIVTATLASIGTAGVPGVGLITLAMVLQQVGLPVEGIALIIGVDRLLDMVRTAVNVTGDATVSCLVAGSEGQLDRDIFEDPAAGELLEQRS
ncbi:MAG: dicarboxylate/amino acid:cation symporter [Pseudomonadales bacterium]|nr:dicarboxylate/amino acid:cation symporter [Pseudomonadales bacterium]